MSYRLLRPGGSHIDNMMLGGYIEAAMNDVIHDETLTTEEKVASLHALAGLARSLSDHWRNVNRYYTEYAERVWFRMCGLTGDGMPTATAAWRISEVKGELWGPDDEGVGDV